MTRRNLAAVDLVAGYDHTPIVQGVSLNIPAGSITAIIGANACGKSTLLKTFARLIRPMAGRVTLDGQDVHTLPPKRLARMVGLLPQSPVVPEGIAVADLVSRGRYPHQSFLGGMTKADVAAVDRALADMGIAALAGRNVDELSGGQRQRVWIAMALAQETDILLLDEPTTYLDIAHQMEILDLLTDLNRERGTTIVMVLHDVSLAARYADHLIALRAGRLMAQSAPGEIVTEALIRDVFELDCAVISDPLTGAPFVVPKGRHHGAA